MSPSLRDETLELRARYDEEPSHSDHVANLARQLYDGLKSWHRLDSRSRDPLDCAAILHDVGWSQTPDGRGHHKHSARLIQQHAWTNLRPDDVALVAQVARYHRKSIPRPEHAEFHALSPAAQRQVLILGGILRLADALDRTHTGKISRVETRVADDALLIRVRVAATWEAERTMFDTKRDLLELAAGRPVRCEAF